MEWDEAKRRSKKQGHGFDFEDAHRFNWDSAIIEVDDREDCGELREVATGFLDDRLVVLVFTRRGGTARVISLRKADKVEQRRYARNAR